MIKLLIFDLDGTLVDAYRAIEESLKHTLKTVGLRLSVEPHVVKSSVGLGDRHFIGTFVKGKDAQKALNIYRRHHKSSLLKHSRLIRGVKKTLNDLKKRGYRLAIVSNRPRAFSLILIKHLDLRRYFDIMFCAWKKDELKPSPKLLIRAIRKARVKRREAVYIGDMAIDVLAGKNAGIRTIAILGGSSSRGELEAAGPSKIVSKPHAILELFPEI